MGTPRSYTFKATSTDGRINPAEAHDDEIGSIQLGGSVEVFTDDADARARTRCLEQIISELPINDSEHS